MAAPNRYHKCLCPLRSSGATGSQVGSYGGLVIIANSVSSLVAVKISQISVRGLFPPLRIILLAANKQSLTTQHTQPVVCCVVLCCGV